MISSIGWSKAIKGAVCACFVMPVTLWADTLTVFAASSLKTALDEVAVAFAETSNHSVTISYAGSSALARQIQLGAPADVFISANVGWMDTLEADGLIEVSTRYDLVGNRLVMIAPVDSAAPLDVTQAGALTERLQGKPIAMALIQAVPAGIYGKEALQHLGHWQGLNGNIAQMDNVRAALALVSAGETPLGIVYASDALADKNVAVVADIPTSSHAPIVYPAAGTSGGNISLSNVFLKFLKTPAPQAIFAAQGFLMAGN
ncbi:molybdate transport system substrate-binding protein [Shimia gijangensis]|uniref:Molybdate transport system substrate-binding protein n=1 Tax=Shimia gijangensis TaxID=1470563 RepID=A0A1M6LP89_9RHOB|nr:molybdate ABC transporter substrate-binding protein [Shimia gijangensis]SHJ72973.1 molybdate transport system substrate-binding protein [Shimia gijangensis]